MKSYIGAKIIQATPMTNRKFLATERGQVFTEDKPLVPGYKVVYPDGYVSWSPKEVFETAYRLVTDDEKKLIES